MRCVRWVAGEAVVVAIGGVVLLAMGWSVVGHWRRWRAEL